MTLPRRDARLRVRSLRVGCCDTHRFPITGAVSRRRTTAERACAPVLRSRNFSTVRSRWCHVTHRSVEIYVERECSCRPRRAARLPPTSKGPGRSSGSTGPIGSTALPVRSRAGCRLRPRRWSSRPAQLVRSGRVAQSTYHHAPVITEGRAPATVSHVQAALGVSYRTCAQPEVPPKSPSGCNLDRPG